MENLQLMVVELLPILGEPISTIFEIKQNDTLPPLRLRLTSGGVPVNLAAATLHLRIAGIGTRAMVVEDFTQAVVRYDWQAMDTAAPGTYVAEIKVQFAGSARQTIPTIGQIVIRVHREVPA